MHFLYLIGNKSKVFRQTYHDLFNHRWLWGVYKFIDDYNTHQIPITYFEKWGFSINEGGGPVNIHISWNCPHKFYFYLFIYKWDWHKIV